MLNQFLQETDIKKFDLNCAEQIICGANKVYKLGISREDQKMAASLGGGMAVCGTCGALIAAVMILGRIFTIEKGHKSPHLKGMVKEYIDSFDKLLCSRECYELRAMHKNDCKMIVEESARLLDEIIEKYNK